MEKKSEKITKDQINKLKNSAAGKKASIKLMAKTGKQSWDIKQENQ